MSEVRRAWFFDALPFGVAMAGKLGAGVFVFGFALGCTNPAPPPNLPYPVFESPSAIGQTGSVETDAGTDAVLPESDEAVVDSTQVGSADVAGADAAQVNAPNVGDEQAPDSAPGQTDAGRSDAGQ